ncbi:MAG: cysteine hydrolase family protein [Acidobacteriota bacterium]
MPVRSEDLHGSAPDSAPVALLLIDVINDLEFEGGDKLLEQALPMAERVAALKKRAKVAGIPVVYVNDNYGRWRSDFKRLVNHCLNEPVRGKKLAELLRPDEDDYFVLKPKHSGFFSTTLHTLLDYLRVRTLILAGLTGNTCVLFTAHDAYMREFHLIVPPDCVASIDPDQNRYALDLIETVMKAELIPSDKIDISKLARNKEPS